MTKPPPTNVITGMAIVATVSSTGQRRASTPRNSPTALGIKWSRLTDGNGIPIGCVIDGANRHDSPLLRPTLERLAPFGFDLPDQMRVHLDAGYDSGVTRDLLDEFGFDGHIQPKGIVVPIDHTRRWVVERTNSWNSRGFNIVAICTERSATVIEAFLALITSISVTRRLIRNA